MLIADPSTPLEPGSPAGWPAETTPPTRARRIVGRRAGRVGAATLVGVLALGAVATGITWIATPSTSNLLARVAAIDRAHHTTPLTPGHVPRLLAQALVAVEDQQFYHDHGISIEGLARAGLYDLTHGCACQGGSTITQQLAEDLYLHGWDGTLPGRWEDLVLALKVESHLSKRQILAAYLSEVYLGGGAYGAPAASRLYFHRPLAKDTLAQFALLAGLPQAPSALDPRKHPSDARERRWSVLSAMVQMGDISPAVARRAARQSV